MRNIMLKMEYDASRYLGWQRLGEDSNKNTISERLLSVLTEMTKESVELIVAERTEVGVHAYGQIVNFKTASTLSELEIKHYLNRYLPMDIAILEVKEQPERFHCALNARSKTYVYRICIGDVPSVFDRKYTYYSFKTPDVEKMKEAAALLIGLHDFKNFSSVKKSKHTEKEVYDIQFYQDALEILITIKARDFLHNMTRIIIATLLDIGYGIRQKDEILLIFDKGSKATASAPCDAKGLFLQEIEYLDM